MEEGRAGVSYSLFTRKVGAVYAYGQAGLPSLTRRSGQGQPASFWQVETSFSCSGGVRRRPNFLDREDTVATATTHLRGDLARLGPSSSKVEVAT